MTDDDDHPIIPIRPPVQIGEAGGIVDESRATLALCAADLDPDVVSGLLGAHPTMACRRGERRSVRSPPAKQGVWLLTVEGVAPMGPDELLQQLLGRFPRDPAFWDRLREAYLVKLILGVFQNCWNRGFALGPETVALVARTGAALELDIYCDAEEGPE